MDIKKITQANREAWNEVMPVHRKSRKVDLHAEFKKIDFSVLGDTLTVKLKELGIDRADVAQVCCNNGQETISMVNIGAKSAVGYDISDAAIEEARELADIAGADCSFVRTDVYDIGEEHYNKYDIILITIGALPWLPDLDKFFAIVSKMLKRGGYLVVYEQHPIVYMLAPDNDKKYDAQNPYNFIASYFREEPWVDDEGIDYIGKSKYKGKVSYCYTVPLYKTINAIIKSGVTLIEFYEYPDDISSEFKHLEKDKLLPLSILIVGKKIT